MFQDNPTPDWSIPPTGPIHVDVSNIDVTNASSATKVGGCLILGAIAVAVLISIVIAVAVGIALLSGDPSGATG